MKLVERRLHALERDRRMPAFKQRLAIFTCSGHALAAQASCTLDVTFTPQALDARSASLTVTSTDASSPSLTVALSGSGVATAPALSVSPTKLAFVAVMLVIETFLVQPLERHVSRWRPKAA